MFTPPPDLADAEVAAALIWGWDLDVEDVAHAPVGFGSHHWRVRDAAGGRWFATADDLRTRRATEEEPLAAPFHRLRAALTTAAALSTAGLGWVVAPVAAHDGEVVLALHESYALALYPEVRGETFGWGPFEDEAHRAAVVDRLVALHTMDGCREAVQTDDLSVPLAAELRRVLDDPGTAWGAGPFGPEAWQLVVDHAQALRALLDRHDGLVAGADDGRFVVTHGEPHRANIVVTRDAGVVLVDWDTCRLGPPERDLWRIVAEDPRTRRDYEARTGTVLDDRLLEAHALGWDLADVAAFVRVLRHAHDDDEDSRTAWRGLRAAVLNHGVDNARHEA